MMTDGPGGNHLGESYSSFMKAILCSTVSGEEAGTGRKRFTPVPTNPSAKKTYRRFFKKKVMGKVAKKMFYGSADFA